MVTNNYVTQNAWCNGIERKINWTTPALFYVKYTHGTDA